MIIKEWLIDELVSEEDKQRAREGKLKTSEKLEFRCDKHGNYYQRLGDKVDSVSGNKKRGCPRCAKEKSAIKSRSSHVFPDWFLGKMTAESRERILSLSVKTGEELTFVCSRHGEFSRKYGHWCLHLTDEREICPRCAKVIGSNVSREARKIDKPYPNWFVNMLYEDSDKELAQKGKLETHQKCKFVCSKHGVYEKWVYDVIERSTGNCKSSLCPKCYTGPYRSSIEVAVEEYIRSFTDIEIETNVKGYLGKKELDIYIPSIKLAIEVNGSYYHSTLGGSSDYLKDKLYHEEKFLECKKQGIHLISLYDVDWFNKQDRIKKYIKDLIQPKEILYARKLEIFTIGKQEANEFFNKYHLLGGTNSPSVYTALRNEKEVLSIMAFGKPRFRTEYGAELLRYCVLPGVSIVGGAQRLFKYFINNYKVNTVLSYSDNDFFMGDVYERLGFEGTLCSTPRYYWTKDGRNEIKRENSRLKRLSNEYPELYEESKKYGNKEDFIMSSLGYMKVYRSGNFRWVYRTDNLKGGM